MWNIPRFAWTVFSLFFFVLVWFLLGIWGRAQVTAQAILKIRQLLLEHASFLKFAMVFWRQFFEHMLLPFSAQVSTRTARSQRKMVLKSSLVNPTSTVLKDRAHTPFLRKIPARGRTPVFARPPATAGSLSLRVRRAAAQAPGPGGRAR